MIHKMGNGDATPLYSPTRSGTRCGSCRPRPDTAETRRVAGGWVVKLSRDAVTTDSSRQPARVVAWLRRYWPDVTMVSFWWAFVMILICVCSG